MASYYGNFVAIKGIDDRLIRMIDKKETEKMNITDGQAHPIR